MVKRSPKIPLVSGEGADPCIIISDVDWQRIEEAYGCQLSAGVRTDIVEATESLAFFQILEKEAKPVAEIKAVLNKYDKAAKNFFHALLSDPSGSSEVRVYAQCLIERNFKSARLNGNQKLFDALFDLRTSFHEACRSSLGELNDPSKPFLKDGSLLKDGEAWGVWIWRLTKIVKDAGLPPGVRKDTDKRKQEKPSRFVALVRELQRCLTAGIKVPKHSDEALAGAISKARGKVERKRANRVAKGLHSTSE